MKTKVNKGSAEKTLFGLLQQTSNTRPALEEIGRALVASTKNRIVDTKQGPSGAPWAPWATSTMLGRLKNGTASRGLLYESGKLLNSITSQVQQSRSSNGQFGSLQVQVGSQGVEYAQYLQNGTKNMAARPFIGISKEDQQIIRNILRKHVFKKR